MPGPTPAMNSSPTDTSALTPYKIIGIDGGMIARFAGGLRSHRPGGRVAMLDQRRDRNRADGEVSNHG
jgi:hypothetical protein